MSDGRSDIETKAFIAEEVRVWGTTARDIGLKMH
jgi:hypothetical protein